VRDGRERDHAVADFHKYWQPAYCTSVHKAQGDTIAQPFCVWEAPRMRKDMAYTAFTRAQQLSQVSLGLLPRSFGGVREARELKACNARVAGYRASDVALGRPVCDLSGADMLADIRAVGGDCPRCGEPMKTYDHKKRDPRMATYDRVNCKTGGHTRDNVEVCCLGCNVGHEHEHDF
jgi:hypothetical protein